MKQFNVFVVLSDSTLKVKKDGHSNFESFNAAYEVALDQVKVFETSKGTGTVYVLETSNPNQYEPWWRFDVDKGEVNSVDFGFDEFFLED